MAQNPVSAEYDGTPRSVTATGLVDYELPPAAIPSRFSRHSQGVHLRWETFGDSLHGTNVNQKLAPSHRRRALWTSTVNVIQNYGDVRYSPADWTDGRYSVPGAAPQALRNSPSP